MNKAFGTEFVLVNDVRQLLDPKIFTGGPWVHLATVQRGLKEYMAFQKVYTDTVYIEEVDPKEPGLLKQIEDDIEFEDLYRFLLTHGHLAIMGLQTEIKVDKAGLPGIQTQNE